MEIKVESTSVLENGDVSVKVILSSGERNEKKTFNVTPADWREMKLKSGREINETEYDALVNAADFCGALSKGISLLSYGANSHTALERKLIRRGFDEKAASRAADYLGIHGYINESSDADAIIDSCLSRGYGSRRIILKLRERGYDGEVLKDAEDKLSDVDFVQNCAGVIKKRCGKIPKDKDSRDRIVSAMVRYGYSFTEIRDAVRLLEEKA